MPEAYSECEEILAEIVRLHPEWIRLKPDLWWYNKHYRDWIRPKRGFWDRVRKHPEQMAKLTRFPLLDYARADASRRKAAMKALYQGKQGEEPLIDISSDLGETTPRFVPLWRVNAANSTLANLIRPNSPYRDWLLPWLDTRYLTRTSWDKLWFDEVITTAVPRQWIRSKIEWLQCFRKISPGSPGDSQLSSYLTEANFIASSDKIFADVIDECAKFAPFRLASTVRLSGGQKGVEDLMQWFADRVEAKGSRGDRFESGGLNN